MSLLTCNDVVKLIIIIATFLFVLGSYLPDPVYCKNGCGHSYRGPGRKGSLQRHIKYFCRGQKKF